MTYRVKKAEGSPKTPDKRTSAKKAVSIGLGAGVSFIIATILLGYALGNYYSTDWKKRDNVTKFIATHYKPRPESDPVELRLRVGDRDLVYKIDTEEFTEEQVLPIPDLQTRQSKDTQSVIHSAGLLGASASAVFPKVRVFLGKGLKGKTAGVVAAVAVLGIGGVWGFSMAYTTEPDYSSKLFQEMLRDKVVWRGLAKQYRNDATPSRAIPSATP